MNQFRPSSSNDNLCLPFCNDPYSLLPELCLPGSVLLLQGGRLWGGQWTSRKVGKKSQNFCCCYYFLTYFLLLVGVVWDVAAVATVGAQWAVWVIAVVFKTYFLLLAGVVWAVAAVATVGAPWAVPAVRPAPNRRSEQNMKYEPK